jgi:uncharacterized protein (TIGR03435 family)
MAFEVASVKESKCVPPSCGSDANINLQPGDVYSPTGGLFTETNWYLMPLIVFAYKLDANHYQLLTAQLPKWANAERLNIEARAPNNNPTKDQFRLMMQSLLADRFKLTTHHETRQIPVFAIVLSRPGKTGPQLTPHTDDAMCVTDGHDPLLTPNAGLPPFPCGSIIFPGLRPSVPGRIKGGGRDLTIDYIAAFLTGFQGLERPVVNRTGLGGKYDFWMELTPQLKGSLPDGVQVDSAGPTVLEALQEQLGLKLESTTGPVDVLVIDHVEQPSEN